MANPTALRIKFSLQRGSGKEPYATIKVFVWTLGMALSTTDLHPGVVPVIDGKIRRR